jgi:branched-chain amino acid transport system permease protein
MGMNVNTIFIWAWGLAGLIGMAAGFLMGNIFDVRPELSDIGLKAFPVLLLGGLESIGGCLIAGPIIGIVEQLTAAYLDPLVRGGLAEVMPFVFMVTILFFKPFGLFGEERIERI